MKNYRESLKRELENPEFKKEWDALAPEFNRVRHMLNLQSVKYFRAGRVSRFKKKPANYAYN